MIFNFIVENAELGKIVEPIGNITFDKLQGKSLGCPSNILFWNDQQKHVSSRTEKMEHTLLMGDYGTGNFFQRSSMFLMLYGMLKPGVFSYLRFFLRRNRPWHSSVKATLVYFASQVHLETKVRWFAPFQQYTSKARP